METTIMGYRGLGDLGLKALGLRREFIQGLFGGIGFRL